MKYNFQTLTLALQSWVEDDEDKFTANIPQIIKLGELKLARDLNLEIFKKTVPAVFVSGSPTVAKPADTLSLETMTYVDPATGAVVYVYQRTYDYVIDYGGTGAPLYYSEEGVDTWRVAPTPVDGMTCTIRYISRPTALEDQPAGTWLSLNAGDLLLYSCLVCCEGFVKDDGRLKMWLDQYNLILPVARVELDRLARRTYA